MDEWMDGWMDGWVGGWIDELKLFIFIRHSIKLKHTSYTVGGWINKQVS